MAELLKTMEFSTARLCDQYAGNENFQIAEHLLRNFGNKESFCGSITTVRCFEDSGLIAEILAETGKNRVLVIDGGGSHRCALIGKELAQLACNNGWEGLVIYGCVRDSAIIRQLPVGIFALHGHPLFCHSKGSGERNVLLAFAGANFRKDHYLYADSDGIIVSEAILS